MKPGTRGNRRGMTLLELMVGLVIVSVVSAIGYGAFSTMVDQNARSEIGANAVTRPALLRLTLARWLSGIHLLANEGGPPFRALDGVYRHLPDADLTFLTTASTPVGQGETVVRLFIDRDDKTAERGLAAEFTEWPGRHTVRLELDSTVAGMSLTMSSRAILQVGTLPSWVSSTLLPSGVELRLFASEGDSLAPALRIPIRARTGGGV